MGVRHEIGLTVTVVSSPVPQEKVREKRATFPIELQQLKYANDIPTRASLTIADQGREHTLVHTNPPNMVVSRETPARFFFYYFVYFGI